jgi:hypothetical protein
VETVTPGRIYKADSLDFLSPLLVGNILKTEDTSDFKACGIAWGAMKAGFLCMKRKGFGTFTRFVDIF